MNQKIINLIGYACGIAAAKSSCADGPTYLQASSQLAQLATKHHLNLLWKILSPDNHLTSQPEIIAKITQQLAVATERCVAQHEAFCVIAGDHSSGIGTWSGVAKALRPQGDLGLIWIDAHLDAHTPETTHTGNIHGMPTATLLGHGHEILINIAEGQAKIKPQNICYIGIRSFETQESELLDRLGTRIYYIEEVIERGFPTVFKEALQQVKKHTAGFGISLDLDGLDPIFAPGTGMHEPNGLSLPEVLQGFATVHSDPQFLGLEIAEFDPHNCPDGRTVQAICDLLSAVYG